MADVSEAFKALRNTLLGDATLAAMLGTGEAIFFAVSPVSEKNTPLLEFKLRQLNPQGNVSKTGIYRPEFDVNIVATSLFTCHAISGYLEEFWTVPKEHAAAVDSDNYSITEISWGQVVQVPSGKLINTNTPVYQLSVALKLRIVRTS